MRAILKRAANYVICLLLSESISKHLIAMWASLWKQIMKIVKWNSKCMIDRHGDWLRKRLWNLCGTPKRRFTVIYSIVWCLCRGTTMRLPDHQYDSMRCQGRWYKGIFLLFYIPFIRRCDVSRWIETLFLNLIHSHI